ncbi:MAG: hypothetical protein LBS26_06650 [Campylobacteraceae bacterium]|jgi:hypothetical protein|nr:hypothetical protein [Campylobacteraceae bacterium]
MEHAVLRYTLFDDGLPAVFKKRLHAALPEIEIAFDAERGIVVSDKSAVEI